MATKSTYLLQVHKLVNSEDLPSLPKELQQDFKDYCASFLINDPYGCYGLPHHMLRGKLKDCIALEVEWDGDPNAYRMVYRVHEKPAPRRVEVLSFIKHEKNEEGIDPPYHKAQERLGRLKNQKK